MIFLNEALTDITGYSSDDVGLMKFAFLAGWHTNKETLQVIINTIQMGQSSSFNALFYRKDGSAFWSEMYVSPVKDKNSKVTHYVILVTDITEQRQIREALIEAKEQAERASAVKVELSGGHEPRNPHAHEWPSRRSQSARRHAP